MIVKAFQNWLLASYVCLQMLQLSVLFFSLSFLVTLFCSDFVFCFEINGIGCISELSVIDLGF